MNNVMTSSPLFELCTDPHKWIIITVGVAELAAAWFLGSFLKKTLLHVKTPTGHSMLFMSLAAHSVKAVCIVAGILLCVATLGFNISSLIQSIAVLGFGISFIFKDPLSDIAAGFALLNYKPLAMGSEIIVIFDKGSYTGTVKAVGLRYITLDNSTQTILVPHSILFKQPLCILKK